jgi:hypothetical protein
MTSQAMDRDTATQQQEVGGRQAPGAGEAPIWHYASRTTPQAVVELLNFPPPLPNGAVSVSATPGQFHIFWRE